VTNPLAFTPLEVASGVSTLFGVATAVFLLGGAARSHFEWLPAIITAVLAVGVPFVGPAVALFVLWKLSRVRREAPRPTDFARST
jgi:hypothetical protein